MKNKCLVIYSSMSGNTEKVALRINKTFEKNGWKCDVFKIGKDLDVKNPPFDYGDYDFLCAGSPTIFALPVQEIIEVMRQNSRKLGMHKLVPGPKCSIVFSTYGGAHLGPREAEACLTFLAIECEHLGFKTIGEFSCPGKYVDYATPEWYHGDIRDRPNEKDLKNAAGFVEKVLQSKEVEMLQNQAK